MTEVVQQMFGYHPDIAEQMLDEAGLPGPDRFTTSIIVPSTRPDIIEVLQIIQEYWANVGVTLDIRVKEYAAHRTMSSKKSYEHGVTESMNPIETNKWTRTESTNTNNKAIIREPLIDGTFAGMRETYFNWPERARILKEAAPELASLAPCMFPPLPHMFIGWQPWVKGYHGERYITYICPTVWPKYVWIDRDLKEEMTGRR